MGRQAVSSPARLELDRRPGAPSLQAQVFQRFRQLIAEGWLKAGARIPSTRRLAGEMGVSRGTVIAAIEDLRADGWIVTRSGSGAFVAELAESTSASLPPASVREQPQRLPFAPGVPGLDLFPMRQWTQLHEKRWRSLSSHSLLEGESAGWAGLRESIAARLRIVQGLACRPEQVLITNSARSAMFLCAQLLAGAGERAWIEDPGYFGARDALRAAGVKPVPVPVDDQGIRVAEGLAMAPDARLALVTPHCQFPTGAALGEARRRELVDWAETSGGWIVENGYESELLPGTRGRAVLAGETERYVYVNSFHRTLYPDLRIGFAVVPEAVFERFAAARQIIDGHSNLTTQMVLKDFIDSGQFDEHVRRCRDAYAERHDILSGLLAASLSPWLEKVASGATHLVARVQGADDARGLCLQARTADIELTPMTRYLDAIGPDPRLVLGFAAFNRAALQRAAARLRKLCESLPGA
jgi:GntR family transcriptional regulator/MocR family aminotransferase